MEGYGLISRTMRLCGSWNYSAVTRLDRLPIIVWGILPHYTSYYIMFMLIRKPELKPDSNPDSDGLALINLGSRTKVSVAGLEDESV